MIFLMFLKSFFFPQKGFVNYKAIKKKLSVLRIKIHYKKLKSSVES